MRALLPDQTTAAHVTSHATDVAAAFGKSIPPEAPRAALALPSFILPRLALVAGAAWNRIDPRPMLPPLFLRLGALRL